MSLVDRYRDEAVAFASSLEVTHDLPLTVDAVRRADRGTGHVNSVKASCRQYPAVARTPGCDLVHSHDVARVVDSEAVGCSGTGEGNRGKRIVPVSHERGRHSSSVVYHPDDLPRWVDTVCLRARTARDIDRGEGPTREQKAVTDTGDNVLANNVTSSVDAPRKSV